MQALAQAFLIGCGMLGLLFTTPIAIYTWIAHRSFGGDILKNERQWLWAPLAFLIALAVGLIWRRVTKRRELPRPAWKLTEDGTTGI